MSPIPGNEEAPGNVTRLQGLYANFASIAKPRIPYKNGRLPRPRCDPVLKMNIVWYLRAGMQNCYLSSEPQVEGEPFP